MHVSAASPMPVLPEVASTRVVFPGVILPFFSASSMSAYAENKKGKRAAGAMSWTPHSPAKVSGWKHRLMRYRFGPHEDSLLGAERASVCRQRKGPRLARMTPNVPRRSFTELHGSRDSIFPTTVAFVVPTTALEIFTMGVLPMACRRKVGVRDGVTSGVG